MQEESFGSWLNLSIFSLKDMAGSSAAEVLEVDGPGSEWHMLSDACWGFPALPEKACGNAGEFAFVRTFEAATRLGLPDCGILVIDGLEPLASRNGCGVSA